MHAAWGSEIQIYDSVLLPEVIIISEPLRRTRSLTQLWVSGALMSYVIRGRPEMRVLHCTKHVTLFIPLSP